MEETEMEECTHSPMNELLNFLRRTTYTGGESDAKRGGVVAEGTDEEE